MEVPFRKGDVVQLASGGPAMTVHMVEEWHDDFYVKTQWFEGRRLMEGGFPASSLEIHPDYKREVKSGVQ